MLLYSLLTSHMGTALWTSQYDYRPVCHLMPQTFKLGALNFYRPTKVSFIIHRLSQENLEVVKPSHSICRFPFFRSLWRDDTEGTLLKLGLCLCT